MAKVYSGRWRIVEPLPEGGQGWVYRVRDEQAIDADDRWVLKRLKNPNRLQRFGTEISALQKMRSPRIPEIADFSLDTSEPYFVSRFVGPTLESYLEDHPLTFDQVYDLWRDAIEAVRDAHSAGVLHRDIKPGNIVVDESGSAPRAMLIDFGICQVEGGEAFTTTGEALGSRSFSAPEMDAGARMAPTERSDVYSLGKVLYWALTGGRHLHRETVDEAAMQDVPQPRGVERPYVQRILKKVITDQEENRITADELLTLAETYGILMRDHINAVGSRQQVCRVCRMGQLRRVNQIDNLGYRQIGEHVEANVRLLRCSYCGYIQHHLLSGTDSEREGLWEI